MTGRSQSHQCDRAGDYSAGEIAQQYISSPHRRMSQPSRPSFLLENPDLHLASPTTPKKKKKKPREKRRNSRARGKGDINYSDESIGTDEKISEIGSPLVSPSSPSKKKNRSKSKKNRNNSEPIGIVIIPDCENGAHCDNENESARFSAVTEPTQLLDDDDFTASTKDASTKDEKKKFPKSPKSTRKKKVTKDKTRASSVEKTRSKTPTTARRSSLTKRLEKKEAIDDKKNASWGVDTRGTNPNPSKSCKTPAPELLNVIVDPGLQLDGFDLSKPPSLKKSNSFVRARKPTSLSTRRGSVGSNLNSQTKLKDRPLRSKTIQDPRVGLKNESWGSPLTPPGPSTRASHELLSLYTSPHRVEKAMPQLRRNAKSFNSAESWRTDPKRDHDIPSILFISCDESEPGFNESWDSRQFDRPSSRKLDRPSSIVQRKETINGSRVEEHKPRARSTGAMGRRRSSTTRQRKEKPPQPLRKEKPRGSIVNETWSTDPRNTSNKTPLSPRLVDMLGMSPSAKKKSPGRFKKTIAVNGMKSSPSLNSLKNNLKKLRGGGTKENKLKAVPLL